MNAKENPTGDPVIGAPTHKILLIVLSVLISLLAGEGIIRSVLGPRPVNSGTLYRNAAIENAIGFPGNEGDSSMFVPANDCLYAGKRVHINRMGIRDAKERTMKPAPFVTRIAMFGDSFTFGEGVDNNETFPAILDSILAALTPSRYETLNFGVPRFNTIQEYLYLQRFGNRTAPDIVLFQWLENDVLNEGYVGSDLDIIDSGKPLLPREVENELSFFSQLHEWLKNKSDLYMFMVPAVKELANRFLGWHWGVGDAVYTDLTKPGARLSMESLRRAAQFCKNHDMLFGVIIYPVPRSLKTDYYQTHVYSKVGEYCRANNIQCLNLFPGVFYGRDFRELIISRRNIHPNAASNRLAAEAVAKWLSWTEN